MPCFFHADPVSATSSLSTDSYQAFVHISPFVLALSEASIFARIRRQNDMNRGARGAD